MSARARCTNDELVAAYQKTGSVWKAGKELGLAGQSVWERLRILGYPMAGRHWTAEEHDELRALAGNGCSISEIANRLGRPYMGVAIKLSRLEIRIQTRRKVKLPRGAGYDKESTRRHLRDLGNHSGSLKQFCVARSLSLDSFIYAVQRHYPEAWDAYAASHTDLAPVTCPNCDRLFYPMTKRQETCSRKCGEQRRKDHAYFGGKRRTAVGLIEGICQLCERQTDRGLSAHHVLGKDNDPENAVLVALCQGCHRLVGDLAGRTFVENPRALEALIGLALVRRRADRGLRNDLWIMVDIEECDEPEITVNPL